MRRLLRSTYRRLAWAWWWPLWDAPRGHPDDWTDMEFRRMYGGGA